jgi:probable O-glycosylation ligase (exosortase A-associated)
MNPHRLTWGFSYGFNFAAIVAVVTLISALLSRDLRRPPIDTLNGTLLVFILWTGVTTIFALHPEASLETWKTLMKTQLLACLIPMLFRNKEDLRRLLWVIVLSVAYYGTKGGAWTLLTGGAARVWGPPSSYIEDNNAIAVAIVMIVPLLRYLQLTTPHRYVRWGLMAMMVLCAVAVLGTYSRGALLAIAAMATVLWWKGGRKLILLSVIGVTLASAVALMPEKWHERMETITNYEEDRSAAMRLNAWWTMLNLAMDRPVTGGGFAAAEPETFQRYSPNPQFPPQVAHSIYFQALGEHGFIGLALYLLLLCALWRTCNRIIETGAARPDLYWAYDLSRMMQVSLVGYAVGGAFLSLVNFDVPYYLISIMVAIAALARGLPAAQDAIGSNRSANPRPLQSNA